MTINYMLNTMMFFFAAIFHNFIRFPTKMHLLLLQACHKNKEVDKPNNTKILLSINTESPTFYSLINKTRLVMVNEAG